MLRRLVAGVVAVVVGVVGWVAGAGPAAAAGAWWLPSAWMASSVGTVADARDYLSGGTGSLAVTAGTAPAIGPAVAVNGANCTFLVTSVTTDATGVDIYWTWTYQSFCYNDRLDLELGRHAPLSFVCTDGTAVANQWSVSVANHMRALAAASNCSGHGGLARIAWAERNGGSGVSEAYNSLSVDVGGGAASTTTEVWCRDVHTGVDQVVSETAESASVAPAPVCPAGTVAVRVRVTNSVDGVVSDTSLTSAAVDGYWGYLSAPGEWTWHDDGGDSCHIQNSTDPTMVIALSVDVCNEANGNGTTQAEQVQDCGSDIVCAAIQAGTSTIGRILTGIASGISGIAGTVKSIGTTIIQAASSIVQGIVGGLGGILERIITAIEAVKGAIETGIAGILEKLGELIGDLGGGTGDDGGGDGTGGTGPGNVSLPNPGDVTSKFTPWTDALRDLIEVFDRGDPGCAGPEFVVNLQVGGHVYPFGGHPFDSCSEPMAGIATLVRSGLAIVFIVSGAAACIRILGSTFGVSGVGGGGGSEE